MATSLAPSEPVFPDILELSQYDALNITQLSTQLTLISDALKAQDVRISRLAKLPSQSGSESRDGTTNTRTELAQDIHESLKQLDAEFNVIRQEAESYSSEAPTRRGASPVDNEESRLTARVARVGEDLLHSRQQFRNAQIAAKRTVETARLRDREKLLAGYRREAQQIAAADQIAKNSSSGSSRDQLFAYRGKTQQLKQQTKDEVLISASSDVTSALRRTHDLLATELSRSRFAQETLEESTAALAQLGDDYSSLDSILSNSRNLLGTLVRSQKSDTWYLETAFYILLATLCWLFFRRILYGPFIKLPLFLSRSLLFLANWTILKPLWFFLTATGVIIADPATRSIAVQAVASSSRAPLIIQPSAQGRPVAPDYMSGGPAMPGIPVGGGGAGAKVGKDGELDGKVSEQIGKMTAKEHEDDVEQPTEESKQSAESGDPQPEADLPRRGDGTVLQERGDTPRNPKKKIFNADHDEREHREGKRDEL